MSIPSDRMNVAGATAQLLNRSDFITTNEVNKFNTVIRIPNKLVNNRLDQVAKKLDINTFTIYNAVDNLGFSKELTSLRRMELSVSTADMMNKGMSILGQSIGGKKLISSLFTDCAFDGENMDMLRGLLIGLLPAIASQQNCNNGLISKINTLMSGDITPDMIGKSLIDIANNIKDGKGEAFLKDLNLNADIIQVGVNLVSPNNTISKIVDKSLMALSKNPTKAFSIITQNMDQTNTVFNGSEKLFNVAKKQTLSKYPQIPSQATKVVNKVSYSDVLTAKSYSNEKISNLFV